MNKVTFRKKSANNHFMLVWHKGGYISGSEWSIARKYCKAKRLILGLVKIEGVTNLYIRLKSTVAGYRKELLTIQAIMIITAKPLTRIFSTTRSLSNKMILASFR